jgi:NAD(P)-dependent dehydrogenase (short-subunit alcohol dehydrogenase family)
VLTLTRALAMELAAHKIRVNAIAPGMVLTERVKALGVGGAGNTGLANKHLLGPGEPEDVANAALYLASEEAARVTGVILPVDSGASAV